MSDELIAATAPVHDLIVVTRNVVDFEAAGCNRRRRGRPRARIGTRPFPAQDLQRPLYPPRPGLWRLCGFDRHHVAALVAVRQLGEPGLLGRIGGKGGGEVGRDLDLARRVVDFQLEFDNIAARDACARPDLGADADPELAVHGR